MIPYSSFGPPAGQDDNMGGTTQRIFFAPISYFDTIQTPAAGPVTFDAKSKIVTAHTFLVGKGFSKIYCTANKGKIDAKSQGETDGKSLKMEGEFFFPGSLAMAHGLASTIKNENLIILTELPDSADNGYIQTGSEMFPAKIDPEFTSSTNEGGVRGYTFKYYANTPTVYIYDATITEQP